MAQWLESNLHTTQLAGQVRAREQAQPSTTSSAQTIDGFIVQRMDEAGLMGLGAAIIIDINPYHPNEKVTLRQIATHTSGITDQDVLQYHLAIFRELFKHAEALKQKG